MKLPSVNGKLFAATLAGLLLAGCEANGGFPGNNGGLDSCTLPITGGETVTAVESCLLCSVDSPNNVIDADPDSHATINVTSLLGGLAVLQVRAQDGVVYPAGNIAGFVLALPTPLVTAGVLPEVSIITKLDHVVQDEKVYANILALDLLGLLGPDGRFFLGFTTTKDFDSVAIHVSVNLANVLQSIEAYAACGDAEAETTFPGLL